MLEVSARPVSSVISRALAAIGLLGILVIGTAPAFAQGGAPERLPLSQFLDAQGSGDVWYPPEPALFAWSGRPPDYPRMGLIDYAGVMDRYIVANGGTSLGTQVTGTFTKRMVGDNLAEYSVSLHAENALAWCVRGNSDTGWDGVTMLFGAHADDVVAGATPALGRCNFTASWRQNADEPVADINLAGNWGDPYRPGGWQMLRFNLRGTAYGPLHAEAGLGPEGTPGQMVISQTNTNPRAVGRGRGNADWWPAEVMDLRAVTHD